MYDSMITFIEHNTIPLQQNGFIPGKSIVTSLLCCLSDWTKQFDMGQFLDVVYLDFSKAFDRVPVRRLLLRHEHYEVNLL